jgi:hypothetical protein
MRTGSSASSQSRHNKRTHRSRPSQDLTITPSPKPSTELSESTTAHSLALQEPAAVPLPPHLSWLADVRVELLVDQEGFRTIRPAFVLAAYHDVPGEPCVAEFRPVSQIAHRFHHSALDPDPVLRRVIIGDAEEHDHVTRNAALAIKTPGVYAISGTEALTAGARAVMEVDAGGSGAPRKLPWRLVYVVSERVSETTGAPLTGERALTPLGFSCAPMLLHPSSAHRVSLFQLAKKTARPKLTARRLGPPKPAAVPLVKAARAHDRENMVPAGLGLAPVPAPNASSWAEHERAVSGASTDDGRDDEHRSLLRPGSKTPRSMQYPFVAGYGFDDSAALGPVINRNILSATELNQLVSASPLVGEKDLLKAMPKELGGLAPRRHPKI